MASQFEVESVVARLMAAFPTYKMPRPTVALWVQKLNKTPDLDLRGAAEQFIERGTKFPSIGEMLNRSRAVGSEYLKRKSAEEDAVPKFWIDAGFASNMTAEQRRRVYDDNFEVGRRNAEDHLERMLTTRDLSDCPCMSCVQRRKLRSTVGTP